MGDRKLIAAPSSSLKFFPAYSKLMQGQEAHQRNPVSYRISPYGINLPSPLNMTGEKVRKVCDTLKEFLT
jgi:perosamine synthetase